MIFLKLKTFFVVGESFLESSFCAADVSFTGVVVGYCALINDCRLKTVAAKGAVWGVATVAGAYVVWAGTVLFQNLFVVRRDFCFHVTCATV